MNSIVVNEICAMDIKNHGKAKESTIDMYETILKLTVEVI